MHNISNKWIHFWELCLALLFMTGSYMFWSGESLPNNANLVYPLHQVSTLECRNQPFSTLSDNCKINLPLINQANYDSYQDNPVYTGIYTALWGASYQQPRNQSVGAHYAVDIATARWTPLYALADGEVYAAEFNSAYGNVVKIKFKYAGEVFYAIYAHMDSFSVKKGDSVKKGQKIWEVGNSGTTFGALWGFHVHFEIDRDAGGRPAYAFSGCPDLNKGHSAIIAQGLCRVQMIQYTKDPIMFLEKAWSKLPLQISVSPSVPQPDKKPETQPEVDITPILPPKPEISSPSSREITLNVSQLDLAASQFVNKWDIRLEKDFSTDLSVGAKGTLTIAITDKKTWEPFNWTLPQPLLLISNTTDVQISPVSSVVVSQWMAKVILTSDKATNAYVSVNFWANKIGNFQINIK